MIIRPVRNAHEVEQSIEIYWAHEPPEDPAQRPLSVAHWLVMYEVCPEGFWVAEDEATHQLVGVATAIRRPPQWLLLNFYVLPNYLGQGLGRALLTQVFAVREGCERFAIHASRNPSAQSLYLQFGLYPQPYSIEFRSGPPTSTAPAYGSPSGLTAKECSVAETLPIVNVLDQQTVGFKREVDHKRWAQGGDYFWVQAEGQSVGYFRVSPSEERIGPLIVADAKWMNGALDLAIRKQRELSGAEHHLLVPGANVTAIAYLLAHGYQYSELDLLLSGQPMPGLAQVIFHDMDFL